MSNTKVVFTSAATATAAALLTCGAPAARAVGAPPEPEVASLVATPGWTARTHHDYARRSLLRGRSFARAASHLKEAARLDPKNPEHRLLLGCAHASRAVSLAYARSMNRYRTDEIESYPEQLREWEEQKKEAEARGGDVAAVFTPLVPPAEPFPIKDDGKPYTLTDEAFRAEWDRLHAAALSAWEEGERLSRTPEQQARAGYVRGWGILIFALYDEHSNAPQEESDEEDEAESGEEKPARPDPKAPHYKEALAALENAVELAPENAVYWQSLGDARTIAQGPGSESKPNAKAREAFLRSLRLRPKNAALWQRLAMQELPSYDEPAPKAAEKRRRMIGSLEQAAKADPASPDPLYVIAYAYFDPTPFQNLTLGGRAVAEMPQLAPDKMMEKGRLPENREAARLGLDALVRANLRPAAPGSLRYRTPVPAELSAAWDYQGELRYLSTGFESTTSRALARNAAGYARFLANEGKDPAQARRAADAVLTMGARLTADWPVSDRRRNEGARFTVMVGQTVTEYGYRAKIEVLRKADDSAGVERTEAEWAAYLARKKEWTAAYREAAQTSLMESY